MAAKSAYEFLQELTGVGHTVGAVTEGFPRANALKELALDGAVALLELLQDGLHSASGYIAILGEKAEDHSGPNEGTAGSFHIAHPSAKGPGDVRSGLFVQAAEVAVGAYDSLGAVMGVEPFFLGCELLSGFHNYDLMKKK
jgi:hypothetical protein